MSSKISITWLYEARKIANRLGEYNPIGAEDNVSKLIFCRRFSGNTDNERFSIRYLKLDEEIQ